MDGQTNGQKGNLKQYIMDGKTNGQKGNRKQYIMHGQTNGQNTVYHGQTDKCTKNSISWTDRQMDKRVIGNSISWTDRQMDKTQYIMDRQKNGKKTVYH